MRRTLSILTIMLLAISALAFSVSPVQATAADNTWISDDSTIASNASAWENGTLVTGQNIYFTSAHIGNCSWDVADSFGAFVIRSGTATVTQAVNFSVTSYTQAAATFTGASGYSLTTSAFTQTAGTVTPHVLNLIIGSPGGTISTSANPYFLTVTFNANTILASNLRTTYNAGPAVTIANGVVLTINTGKTLDFTFYNLGTAWTNLGSISGAGTVEWEPYIANITVMPGSISSNLLISETSGGNGNRVLTLASALTVATLTIQSAHASYVCTLDLSTNNYALSATDIMIGTRGILNGRASSITCSGSWDSSTGTFTPGTSQLYLTGTTKTLKTATERINNLILTGSYTMQSNVYCQYFWNNGSLNKGAYVLYDNHDQKPTITSSAPAMTVTFGTNYYYNATGHDQEGESLTWALTSTIYGATVNSTTGMVYVPAVVTTGVLYLTESDGNHTAYMNWTIDAVTPASSGPSTSDLVTIGMSILFGFVFLFAGFKYPVFLMFSGMVWIISSISIFVPYGMMFEIIGWGVGLLCFYEGATRLG